MTGNINRRSLLKGAGAAAAGTATGTAGCLSLVGGGSGKSLTVSSKNFTEQFILSQISIQMLQSAGHEVESKTGLGGSPANFKAVKNGDSAMYWEYTGTAWSSILGKDKVISDPKKLYDKVDSAYNEQYSIDWLQKAPFNNTYVIMANPSWAKENGIKNLNDLAKHAKSGNTDFSVAMNPEIKRREDGWGGLPDTYGFAKEAKKVETVSMKLGLAYKAVKNGEADLGFGFNTNPKIKKFGLEVLEDPKNHFIIYNPAPNVNKDVLDDSMKKTLNEPTSKLTTEKMRSLNAKVSIDGKDPKQVAKTFLKDNGFL
ncbi:glycine betaine ABC transporter substrate-binding protein [Halorussus halophilus]|uniref:glycine betaine ABC transporter substrate-binding protein n=1 Tax=Halorussus halophilus TaxID=2650975 RepID=UPI0013013AF8|nr:glycine betaine ABC transporter substrate-binding protein [Halorussus halophilus]